MLNQVTRAGRLGREVWAQGRNQLAASSFAREAVPTVEVPRDAVAFYFAATPDAYYQFEQWRRPLEHLALTLPVVVVVTRADTGRLVRPATTLPVAFARSAAELERLVEGRRVRVVLYPNQVEHNFRMLRFLEPVHVQIGHGESDKAWAVTNQLKAYDVTLVGGRIGRDRQAPIRWFDASTRTWTVGRPQLDYHYDGAPDWAAGSGWRVLYAPTWEGDKPSTAYGSLASHGVAVVDGLLAEDDTRVIYRPHPRTGSFSSAHRDADRLIRARLAAAGDRHLVDDGAWGWQWDFADACVTDISAIAYDWLATGKPLVLTEPVESSAYRPPSALIEGMPLLPAGEAGRVASWLREREHEQPDLVDRAFGQVADGGSTRRFEAALVRLHAVARGAYPAGGHPDEPTSERADAGEPAPQPGGEA